jgi:hypothetical protein
VSLVRCAAFFVVTLGATARLDAQASTDSLPAIDTDRPDFTDGTHTVPRGYVQLEAGYSAQWGPTTQSSDEASFPELLVRVGVLRRLELRLGENYLVDQPAGAAASATGGFDDTYLASKVAITDAHGAVPGLGAEAQVTLPTGAAAFTADRVLPGAAMLFGWEGRSAFSAGVELLASQTTEHGGQGVASLSVQYQLCSRLQFYGEVYAISPWNSPGDPSTRYFDGGVHVLLSNNVQLDARIGAGLSRAADRAVVGAGFGVRR